jgi:hypothetical protein
MSLWANSGHQGLAKYKQTLRSVDPQLSVVLIVRRYRVRLP